MAGISDAITLYHDKPEKDLPQKLITWALSMKPSSDIGISDERIRKQLELLDRSEADMKKRKVVMEEKNGKQQKKDAHV